MCTPSQITSKIILFPSGNVKAKSEKNSRSVISMITTRYYSRAGKQNTTYQTLLYNYLSAMLLSVNALYPKAKAWGFRAGFIIRKGGL